MKIFVKNHFNLDQNIVAGMVGKNLKTAAPLVCSIFRLSKIWSFEAENAFKIIKKH